MSRANDYAPLILAGRRLGRCVRRQTIQRGWDQFQLSGWREDPVYDGRDPRMALWMNGMEGAERARRDVGFRIEQVDGWR